MTAAEIHEAATALGDYAMATRARELLYGPQAPRADHLQRLTEGLRGLAWMAGVRVTVPDDHEPMPGVVWEPGR